MGTGVVAPDPLSFFFLGVALAFSCTSCGFGFWLPWALLKLEKTWIIPRRERRIQWICTVVAVCADVRM